MRLIDKWSAGELNRLYNEEGKTLQEIGELFSVCRERVRQVMNKLKVKRYRKRTTRKPLLYNTINDYFSKTRIRDCKLTLARLIPKSICSECGIELGNHLHIHHIKYPARSMDDIQILCPSCHKIKHILGISYREQIDIFNRYKNGVTSKSLALKHNVSINQIQKILDKIRNNRRAVKR